MSFEQVIRAFETALNPNEVEPIIDSTDQIKVMSTAAQK